VEREAARQQREASTAAKRAFVDDFLLSVERLAVEWQNGSMAHQPFVDEVMRVARRAAPRCSTEDSLNLIRFLEALHNVESREAKHAANFIGGNLLRWQKEQS